MQEYLINDNVRRKIRLIGCLLLLEYLVFIISGVSFSYLYGNPFFNLGLDPTSWLFFYSHIPQFITSNLWAGILLDSGVMILLLLFIKNPLNNWVTVGLFLLLLCYYVTVMGYLTHQNFQIGFVMVMIPFMFKGKKNVNLAFDATRYFLLFFYFSAGVLKLYYSSLSNPEHFSHILASQFIPYYLERNTDIRTDLNLYLIHYPKVSYLLYIGSFLAEFITVIGFFTKKFDKWIALILLLFHCGIWLIMDIGAIGQISFISLLFLSNDFKSL